MMSTWMASAVLIAAALGVAALLAERALVVLKRPTRWLWLGVMTASAGWPFVGGEGRGTGGGEPSGHEGAASAPFGSGATAEFVSSGSSLLEGVPDGPLIAAWFAASSLVLVVLLLSVATLRDDRRRWRRSTVAGQSVFLSGGLGPAVVGTLRPLIVLPLWVMDLDERSRRLIVLHEREHVQAGDSRVLAAALLLIILLPWCLPLWWHFRRLRLAVETDCDARLLEAGAPARDYAHLLVTVTERRRRVPLPLAAMAASRVTLERRLRRILGAARPGRSRTAVAPMAGAALLCSAAAVVPVPELPSLAALAAPLAPQPVDGPAPVHGVLRPDGSLPGDPGQERLVRELARHHPEALASGLPEGSVIWFIVDRAGGVARTGVERGGEREVGRRIRARHPDEAGEFSFAWSDVPDGRGSLHVMWLLPPP